MADKDSFAKELNDLIMRFTNAGSEPQEIIEELTREANLVFGQYNLEIDLSARKGK